MDRYIEVFGGGGWVLFGKEPDTGMEVYNDYNSDLTNLFRCVKNRPLALLKELNFLPLCGREEFNLLKKYLQKEEFTDEHLQDELNLAQHCLSPPEFEEIKPILIENATMDDVRRAAIFFRLIHYSYGSGCTSYGCQPYDIRKTFDSIWECSRRLKNTAIENKDFGTLIRQYDREGAFFYCDPPYYETEDHYTVEFKKEDHARLHDTLAGCRGKWLLSYNDCEFIRQLYADFRIESVTRLSNLAQRYDNGCEFAEVLISNYDTGERMRALPEQLRLYDPTG